MALAMVSVEATEVDMEQVMLASRFSMQLSPMLENLILFVETKELTIKDDLTQTYNRRYFEASSTRSWSAPNGTGTPFPSSSSTWTTSRGSTASTAT